MIAGPDDGTAPTVADDDADTEEDFEELPIEGHDEEQENLDYEHVQMDGADKEQEEAAFWIPQATPDGRLFYFNTLTGVSTVELPLETPSSSNEMGPRDRSNIDMPERTRPPAERMAGGYEREDDTDYEASASEAEGMMTTSALV